ncbi:hypothetical protein [Streptomyces zhihengii]
MTESVTERHAPPCAAPVLATVLCAAVLLVLNALGGYFLLNALLTESEGPWDHTVTDTVRLMAGLALGAEAVAAAATAWFVAAGCVRRWWYAVPVALAVVAGVRMVFAPTP